MATCVILGGTGFLGRHVGPAMHAAGYDVWSVDIRNFDQAPEWLAGHVTVDFFDVASWEKITGPAAVVIHLVSATVPATANTDPIFDTSANLIGTLRLIEALKVLPVPPLVLFASSGGAVYGVPEVVPMSEEHPARPMSAYGVTKLAIEHHLHIAERAFGIPCRILRLSNPYGEWQSPNSVQGVIAVFTYHALAGKPIHVWGDGSVVKDFIYAGDVGSAFVAASNHKGGSSVFNIGGGAGQSVNHIIHAIENLLGRAVERITHPTRPFDPPINILDVERAEEELKWHAQTPFDEGVAKTFEWIKMHHHRGGAKP